jgi:CRP/FNR family transcriptional regulator, cyclic AMP receptor protein
MPEKPGHHGASDQKKPKHAKQPEERSDIPAIEPEGIVVERWGNPNVLDLVRDDRSIVIGKGQILFKEGDPADCMYIVRNGTLRIRSGSIVYEDAIAGGIVGEMAMVEDNFPRSAMVYALTVCELVKIDEPRFFSLIAETPSFARTVMRVLSRRLRRMDQLYRADEWAGRS